MITRPSLTMMGLRSPALVFARRMPRLTVRINRSHTKAVIVQ